MPRAMAPEETITTSWPEFIKALIWLTVWFKREKFKHSLLEQNKLDPTFTTILL